MPDCLTSRSVIPPLNCYLLFSRRNWLAAIRRQHGIESGVAFHRVESVSALMEPGRIKYGSVVLIEFPGTEVSEKGFLELIWKLTQRRIHVIVAGNERETEVLRSSLFAGTACVVTNEEDCDRVARLIEAARRRQIPEFVDWKEDFLRRLPWKSISAP